MKQIFKQSQKKSFWNLSDSEMHTLALRAGVVIPEKEWNNLVSKAKAYFFVSPNEKGPTKSSIVNIAIKIWKEESIHNCFA